MPFLSILEEIEKGVNERSINLGAIQSENVNKCRLNEAEEAEELCTQNELQEAQVFNRGFISEVVKSVFHINVIKKCHKFFHKKCHEKCDFFLFFSGKVPTVQPPDHYQPC